MPRSSEIVKDEHQEQLEQAAEKSAAKSQLTAQDILTVLPMLIEKLGVSRPLETIINDRMRGEDLFDARRAIKRTIQRRINSGDTTSGAEMLARAVVRQLRFHFDNDIEGVSTDIKGAIVKELGSNVARALLIAASYMLTYPDKLYDLQIAVEDRDARNVAKLRTDALLTEDEFRRALMNVGRACTGDDIPVVRS